MEILAKVHAKNLIKWAKNRPEVMVLSADLTSSTEIDLFRDTYPERFFSMGIAEQNMLSFAGGFNHMHITTLKPFDDPAIMQAVAEAKFGVITMENHSIIGGLGSILAEKMAEAGLGRKLVRIGIKDVFLHGASKPYLMKEYGLDALALISEIEILLNANFNIQESDLAAVYLAPVHSAAKAEAL